MRLIDSHRIRQISQSEPYILDLSGFNLTRDFSFVRSSESNSNFLVCAYLVGWEGAVNQGSPFYVFYDGHVPTLNSKISSNPMVPTSETLGDRYTSTGWNYRALNVFCNITGANVAMPVNYFLENGAINTLNGKPVIRLLGQGSSSGNKIPELESNLNHTCHAIGSNSIPNSNSNFMSTVEAYSGAPFSRYQLAIRSDDTKRISIIRGMDAVTYFTEYSQQQLGTGQRRLTSSYEAGVEIRSYFNSNLQQVITIPSSMSYVNDSLIFGTSPNAGAKLEGFWQAFRIRSGETIDSKEVEFDNRLSEYYNFK